MKHRNAVQLNRARENAKREADKHESSTSTASLNALLKRKPCPCELADCSQREGKGG
jgi:hypothetical protein